MSNGYVLLRKDNIVITMDLAYYLKEPWRYKQWQVVKIVERG